MRIKSSTVASVKNLSLKMDVETRLSSTNMINYLGSQLGTITAIHSEATKRLQELDTPRRVVNPGQVQLGQQIM